MKKDVSSGATSDLQQSAERDRETDYERVGLMDDPPDFMDFCLRRLTLGRGCLLRRRQMICY